jgi:hypothetical protein
MLNKIDNISPGTEYSKAGRPSGFAGGITSAYVRQSYIHDSVNISPAVQFLNLVHWRLKEFKHVAKEKLFLDFILSDIEFQTTIDLVSVERADELNYHIIKDGNETYFNNKIISDMAVKIENIEYGREPVSLNLSALNVLFQRIFIQRVYRELTPNDNYILDELFNGISTSIKEEFEYLNNQLFIFLEKLEGIRIEKRNRKSTELSDLLTVKSIRLINA